MKKNRPKEGAKYFAANKHIFGQFEMLSFSDISILVWDTL